jgi:hypothetical protein
MPDAGRDSDASRWAIAKARSGADWLSRCSGMRRTEYRTAGAVVTDTGWRRLVSDVAQRGLIGELVRVSQDVGHP